MCGCSSGGRKQGVPIAQDRTDHPDHLLAHFRQFDHSSLLIIRIIPFFLTIWSPFKGGQLIISKWWGRLTGFTKEIIYIYMPRSTTLLYINVLTYNILSYIYSKLETLPALNADACLPTSIVTNTTITPTTSTTTTSFNATDSMVFSPMSSIQEQEQVS